MDNEIRGSDLAMILDVVGAYWDAQPAYANLMLASQALPRVAASAILLVSVLVEDVADLRGLSRDECLGVLRGAVV